MSVTRIKSATRFDAALDTVDDTTKLIRQAVAIVDLVSSLAEAEGGKGLANLSRSSLVEALHCARSRMLAAIEVQERSLDAQRGGARS